MKRFLKGFTLAEVVITMGIIGVIASVSLPALSVNVQKQQVGPALAKAINTLETANKLALQDNNARRLDQLLSEDVTGQGYLQFLSRYIDFTTEDGNQTEYKDFNSSSSAYTSALNSGRRVRVYTTSDGITYLVERPGRFKTINNYNGPFSGQYVVVYIDTNGINKGPNMQAKDLFRVWVDASGKVIPFGSRAYLQYQGFDIDKPNWTNKCSANSVLKPTYAFHCTGAIVENGYQVKYKY